MLSLCWHHGAWKRSKGLISLPRRKWFIRGSIWIYCSKNYLKYSSKYYMISCADLMVCALSVHLYWLAELWNYDWYKQWSLHWYGKVSDSKHDISATLHCTGDQSDKNHRCGKVIEIFLVQKWSFPFTRK